MFGPSNDGISFTNINGDEDTEQHALNTNEQKATGPKKQANKAC
jgi:hypothetical protein